MVLNGTCESKKKPAELLRVAETLSASKKVVFMGIGNFNRRDDAIGAHIASSIIEKRLGADDYRPSMRFSAPSGDREVLLIAAATTPENFVDDIIEFAPDMIYYIDCADIKDPAVAPGDVLVFGEESLSGEKTAVSTHSMSINLLIEIFKRKIPSSKNLFIGIKPENIDYDYSPDYHKNISPRVAAAGERVSLFITGEALRGMEAL